MLSLSYLIIKEANMITNFKDLLAEVDKEVRNREICSSSYICKSAQWEQLSKWMDEHGYINFNEDIGAQYCKETFGTYICLPGMSKKTIRQLRAIRMIISFQKTGSFEFRTPSKSPNYNGNLGNQISTYIKHCTDTLNLANPTVRNKEHYLCRLNGFLEERSIKLNDININLINEYYQEICPTLALRHNAGSVLRNFLKYCFDMKYLAKDLSYLILPDNYKKNSKLPTTYSEDEIKKLIQVVDRSSRIGKRDYLILLLAAEYGWRAKDIVVFSFDQINWDDNTISYSQSKTGNPVLFPLLASVGNAIIDYLKNGRPKSSSKVIILSLNRASYGEPIVSPTVHSIVSKYMRIANIPNWQNKKHGPHSLRHSLATNMLKKDIALPIISTVLGHQKTETTKVYLSVDIEKLRQCVLPMPTIRSSCYSTEVHSDGK